MSKKKLNIFQSDFLMRANLKEKEIKIQKQWKKNNLIHLTQQNKTKKILFHSGPPYANGNIHIGHALNKILKDFTLRYFSLKGFAVDYKPGWDTHGLPIAVAITKKNPELFFKKNPAKFRETCLNYANEQIKKQILQFERLGLLMDFSEIYSTSDPKYVGKELQIFANLVEKNLIFHSLKPVLWSWSSQTALAEAEIIYKDKKTKAVFFACPISTTNKQFFLKKTNFLAWTTSIWTIPENKILCINQKEKYIKFSYKNSNYIVAKNRFEFLPFFKKIKKQTITTIEGKNLLNIEYFHPYLKQTSKVVHSDHVCMTTGTGVVHVSPAYGPDDYNIARLHKLPFEVAINEKGIFNKKSADPELTGKFYQDSETFILKKLNTNNTLVFEETIKHSYPHDWRTNKPVIYRATPQWYLNLNSSFKKISKQIKRIKWMPKWAGERLESTLKNRQEWCLSRQRSWGVPIPTFINENHELILNSELIRIVASKIEKHGDQIWWQWNPEQLLTKKLVEKYKITNKNYDTIDVWFDSGCSAQILFPNFKNKNPINFIWEGNDQFRGWFNSMLTIFLSNTNGENAVVEKILTHGFVNDKKGLKMSKSKGNTIDPLSICSTLGADVIRIWVANSNFYADINISSNLINKHAQDYLKIRNTIRFLINNLIDFDVKNNFQNKLEDLDLILLFKFNNLIQKLRKNFNDQQFHHGWIKLFQFITRDLSASYFVFAKNIIYESEINNLRRRQIQTTLFIILKNLLIILAPFIPHTAEEAYSFLPQKNLKQSIHLESWPEEIYNFSPDQQEHLLLKSYLFENLKKEFYKILENKIKNKKIQKLEEIEITISVLNNSKIFSSLTKWQKHCKFFFCDLKNFSKKNNILNLTNNFYYDYDLKNFLQIKSIEINFYEKNTKKLTFIKIKKTNDNKNKF